MAIGNKQKLPSINILNNKCHQILVAFVLYKALKALEQIINCSLPIDLNDIHCQNKESTNERQDHGQIRPSGSNSKKKCSSRN
jgi:hypothetical protein